MDVTLSQRQNNPKTYYAGNIRYINVYMLLFISAAGDFFRVMCGNFPLKYPQFGLQKSYAGGKKLTLAPSLLKNLTLVPNPR